jgi:hypothetical protein
MHPNYWLLREGCFECERLANMVVWDSLQQEPIVHAAKYFTNQIEAFKETGDAQIECRDTCEVCKFLLDSDRFILHRSY